MADARFIQVADQIITCVSSEYGIKVLNARTNMKLVRSILAFRGWIDPPNRRTEEERLTACQQGLNVTRRALDTTWHQPGREPDVSSGHTILRRMVH
jgi:hypothetical protein